MELKGGGPPPPDQQTKMSGTISPRDRLQLWVNAFLLKQKENSGSVTATFRDILAKARRTHVAQATFRDLGSHLQHRDLAACGHALHPTPPAKKHKPRGWVKTSNTL